MSRVDLEKVATELRADAEHSIARGAGDSVSVRADEALAIADLIEKAKRATRDGAFCGCQWCRDANDALAALFDGEDHKAVKRFANGHESEDGSCYDGCPCGGLD